MKKYKIFALKIDGEGPGQLGPFLLNASSKKEAFDKAFYHIKNELKLSGNYHLDIKDV